jgi:hypothetical protein
MEKLVAKLSARLQSGFVLLLKVGLEMAKDTLLDILESRVVSKMLKGRDLVSQAPFQEFENRRLSGGLPELRDEVVDQWDTRGGHKLACKPCGAPRQLLQGADGWSALAVGTHHAPLLNEP